MGCTNGRAPNRSDLEEKRSFLIDKAIFWNGSKLRLLRGAPLERAVSLKHNRPRTLHRVRPPSPFPKEQKLLVHATPEL